jgi:hypothetical protein
MPARNTRFRALSDDFRRFLDQRGAWPPVKKILLDLEDKGGGRKAEITRLRAGAVVPEKYVRAMILSLRKWGGSALADYQAGQAGAGSLDDDQLLDLIAGPLRDRAAKSEGDTDWQASVLDGLHEIFTPYLSGAVLHPGTRCDSEGDVGLAVRMILSTVGRQVSGDSGLPDSDATGVAEQFMRIGHADYLQRAIDLWRVARWSFAFAVVERQRVACSCTLPLTESAYEEVRRGGRVTHALSGDDLAVPSRTLFLEAFGHKPDAEYPFFERKTIHTVRIINLQLAALSLGAGDGPLRVLSIAGNKLNEERLKSSGFRRTGTQMPEFGIPFMELDEREGVFITLAVGKLRERLSASGEAT